MTAAWMLACVASASFAQAQAQQTATYAITGADHRDADAWRTRAEAWLEAHGERARTFEVRAEAPSARVPASELAVLDAIEAALRDARERMARFDEAGALRVLSEAEQRLRTHLELPGAHAFLAELYVQMALAAASLELDGLTETALTRASTLDPRRSVQAAEAPPSVVALARRIEASRDTASRSRVRIEAEPEGASIWLDGVALGSAPRDLELSAGLHSLVLRARGHRPYASLVELGSGARSPIRVVLSPEPDEDARLALTRSLHDAARAERSARQLARTTAAAVWLFEVEGDRAEVVRCDGVACLQRGTLPRTPVALLPEGAGQPDAAPDRDARPPWRRWPVWVAASVGVAAAVTLTAFVARDEHTRTTRELAIDPGRPPN